MRSCDLGDCTRLWSPGYLADKLPRKKVRVHVGTEPNLDFRSKNFSYCDMDLGTLLERAQSSHNKQFFFHENEIYYLRQSSL